MFRKMASIAKVYGIVIVLIGTWWTLAFKPKPSRINSGDFFRDIKEVNEKTLPISNLTLVQRVELKRALAGDYSLMAQLIADWDIDARLMQSHGVLSVRRLSNDDFLRSQKLGRMLKNETFLEKPAHRFLPQTYAAASFLLALAPAEIVALPRRLREQTQLYPKEITDRIPLDIDRYNAEKLFLANPEVAFIAPYSHPATIQALSNQGIELYMMKNLNTLSDVTDELLVIGNIINRPHQAELLKIFMDAAIIATDNKLSLLAKHFTSLNMKLPRVLFLTCHKTFSIPTLKTLTGRLLEKMSDWDISLKYVSDSNQGDMWTMPIEKENILKLDPDCLILASENENALSNEILNDHALSQLSAVRNHNVYFVDDVIQQSPTQYIVLAYHDLIQVLADLL